MTKFIFLFYTGLFYLSACSNEDIDLHISRVEIGGDYIDNEVLYSGEENLLKIYIINYGTKPAVSVFANIEFTEHYPFAEFIENTEFKCGIIYGGKEKACYHVDSKYPRLFISNELELSGSIKFNFTIYEKTKLIWHDSYEMDIIKTETESETENVLKN